MSSFCFKFSDHVILINVEWGYRALKNIVAKKNKTIGHWKKLPPILLSIVYFYLRKEIVLKGKAFTAYIQNTSENLRPIRFATINCR